jgi:RNA polymerase sigma factor (sigma-70 family)
MKQTDVNISDTILLEQLLDSAKANEAIASLYQAHYGLLAQFILSNNGSEADAQDIFQEVMVAFVHLVRQGKFRGESSIKTFLFALNRNLWFNELKRKNRSITRSLRYKASQEKKNESITEVIENREASKEILQIMKDLGESCRQVLLLFYYHNESIREIVQKTGYENEQVVRNKKYKCLKKLEEKLAANPNLYKKLKSLLHA